MNTYSEERPRDQMRFEVRASERVCGWWAGRGVCWEHGPSEGTERETYPEIPVPPWLHVECSVPVKQARCEVG